MPDAKPVDTAEAARKAREKLAAELEITVEQAESVEAIVRELGIGKPEALAVARVRHAELFAEREPDPDPESAPEPMARTVREAFDAFEAYVDAAGRYRKNGEPTRERAAVNVTLREFAAVATARADGEQTTVGELPVTELRDVHMTAFREWLETRTLTYVDAKGRERTRGRLFVGGVNRKLKCVRHVCRWLKKALGPHGATWLTGDQLHSILEVENLKAAEAGDRPRKQRKRAVSVEDVLKVADAAGETATMLRIQLATGCRPGEVCRMRWEDIDTHGVEVNSSLCWLWTVPDAKTSHHGGDETTYSVPPPIQRLLEPFEGERGYLFRPARAAAERAAQKRANRKTPLTPSQVRRDEAPKRRRYRVRYDTQTYSANVKALSERVGIEPFTAHEVRHGVLTRTGRRHSALTVQAVANHASIETARHYLHVDKVDQHRVALELADEIEAASRLKLRAVE